MTTLEKVQKTIASETGVAVTPDTAIWTIVTDSLEMSSLVMALEEELGIFIEGRFTTIADLVKYAEAH